MSKLGLATGGIGFGVLYMIIVGGVIIGVSVGTTADSPENATATVNSTHMTALGNTTEWDENASEVFGSNEVARKIIWVQNQTMYSVSRFIYVHREPETEFAIALTAVYYATTLPAALYLTLWITQKKRY